MKIKILPIFLILLLLLSINSCNNVFLKNTETTLADTDIYYGISRFINHDDLPYELSKWKYGDLDENLVTTSINSLEFL